MKLMGLIGVWGVVAIVTGRYVGSFDLQMWGAAVALIGGVSFCALRFIHVLAEVDRNGQRETFIRCSLCVATMPEGEHHFLSDGDVACRPCLERRLMEQQRRAFERRRIVSANSHDRGAA